MKRFIERALNKLSKLDQDQIRSLILDVANESELFEIVLESMTDGLIVLDLDHQILMYNKAAERLLELRPNGGGDEPVWEYVDDDEIAQFFEQNLRREERVYDKQFTLDSSGRLRILSCSIMPLARNGEARGNLIHLEDVTDKRSKEARLRRAENLAALTTLAAGVAHEIKNPLGSIGIHIQLIQKQIKSGDSVDVDAIQKYLDVVMEEVERLNGIVIDFLFAVRPMNTDLERRDLNALVHDTMEFVKYELQESDVKIEERFDEQLPELDLDEKYIKQALLNIIKNAISAMPEGGVLTLSTSVQGDEAVLDISDEGVGIPEENVSKIFEPYFTTKEFGSGLGLTVVYKIIREHGGEVSVSSKVGEGTTFSLSFPIPRSEHKMIGWRENSA